MLIIIASVFAGLVAVFAIVAALQPSTFRLARSVTINAPAAAIFPHVARPRAWEAWSPWLKLDPALRSTYFGPAEGPGAGSSWVSSKVGTGSSTVIESRAPERVRFRLEMVKPMVSTNEAAFTFEPRGEQTIVAWSMSGDRGFVAKAFGLIFNCEKMIGGHFERGLNDLKALVETEVSGAKRAAAPAASR